ncbi:unnamed protein product [Didymodactylos carnosus]|uniref:Replication termination factor 2 n=1 Tax=Didymodactylos carnosus TaxID=1234261 RepID=A0A813VPY2_9BILA|nr:unnamed protein product [Didymodactylos carnosus]CAF1083752.1 unnamed protein product [Didymodactylos carnosus]CAF3631168.1 unnamed protein product [Didymodactylos carnosus]CAF3846376.1 unnamed protein product [Didymodactylos carnosus]
MGCDGGTIPKRDELVRKKKKPEKKDKNAANMAKWRHCSLKHDLLKRPIVSCGKGLLYNKDAVIEYLLDRMKFENGPSHIKNLRDIRELNLTVNPSFKEKTNELGTEYRDVYKSEFCCPLSGLEMNGTYKFCYLWKCGCVVSDRALRSIRMPSTSSKSSLACPKCGKEYSTDDIVIINPETEDDITSMEERRLKLSQQKQTDKRKLDEMNNNEEKVKKSKTNDVSSVTSTADVPLSSTADVPLSSTADVALSLTATTVTSTVVTSKTAINQQKVTTPSTSVATSKLASKSKLISNNGGSINNKKVSIQEDPNTTALYKSLFTTSASAKKQQLNKAHWVTYNPLYY